MADDTTNGNLIELSKQRAFNSIAAHRSRDPAVREARGQADREWGRQQQELAALLPEGDTMRQTVEFIAKIDAMHPLPWLTPPKALGMFGDAFPDPKRNK